MKRWVGTSKACLGSGMDDGRQQRRFQTAVISFPSRYLQELRIKGKENLMSREFNYWVKKVEKF